MFAFLNRSYADSVSSIISFDCTGLTGTSYKFYDNNPATVWSCTANQANTTCTLVSVNLFSQTTDAFIVGINNHNLSKFSVALRYPDGGGGYLFDIYSIRGNTYSNTIMYFPTTTNVDAVQIGVDSQSAIPFIGELFVSKGILCSFDGPEAGNYTEIDRFVGVKRQLADGGVVNIRVSNKFAATMNLDYVPSTTYAQLRSVWESNNDFIFIPFPNLSTFSSPTGTQSVTSWDGEMHKVVWTGDFNFNFKSNNMTAGYRGSIDLKEIPSNPRAFT